MTIQRSTKDMPMLTTMQVAPRDAKSAPSTVKADARRSTARLLGARQLSLLAALAVTALPLVAQAQRKSPLADAPAIRKRYELRKTRFEIGAGGASTINQDFYHTFFVGAKAGFHFTDWLSIAAFGNFAVANVATGFQGSITDALKENPPIDREPTPGEAKAAMQKITNILGAQLEFTPFTGKYSLFGKLFASYDFYGFAGGAVITVKPTDDSLPACQDAKDLTIFSCKVSGMKPGGTLGVGFHSFFTNYFALNVELRDVIAKLNPSGRDVDGVGGANNSDLTWTHTLVVGANLQFFLPATPGVSF
jgi:outer membrane beta-barrel protein